MKPLVIFRGGFYLAPPANLAVPDRCPEPDSWTVPDLHYPARLAGRDTPVADWQGRADIVARNDTEIEVYVPCGSLFDVVIVDRTPTPESSAWLDQWRDGYVRGATGKRAVSDRIVRARSGTWLDGYHNGREARRRHNTEST